MQDLNINLVQADLSWEAIASNLAHLDELLAEIKGPSDLILLPEMFNTGFVTQPANVAESPDGITFRWLRRKAIEKNTALAGSYIVKEAGAFYNSLVWMFPDGHFVTYNKRHLFRMGNEHLRFRAGNSRTVIEWKGWKILPLVCYDLRFPVWSMNKYDSGVFEYDLLTYHANWPKVRNKVWKSLLTARAIENLAYVAAVNRVGRDGNDITYRGESVINDFKGNSMPGLSPFREGIISQTLSCEALVEFREKFNVGPDWDKFFIEI